MNPKKKADARQSLLSSSKKTADLLFSRKLVQLHIVLNMPPFEDLNPHFLRFVEKSGAAYGYDIGIVEFQEILTAWNTKAPVLLNDKDDVEKIMIIIVVWLAMKQQYQWLAKCFRVR